MGKIILNGMFSLVCAAVLVGGNLALAQAQTQTQELRPLTANEARIALDKIVEQLRQRLAEASSLSGEERIALSRDIENEAKTAREALDEILAQATVVGDRTYIMGLVVSFQGGYNIPTFWSGIKFEPGAEAGTSVFMRKNEYLADSLRFSGVAVVNAAAEYTRGASIAQRGFEKGVNFRLLLATDAIGRPAASLADFQGSYTGVGAKMNIFGHRGIGPVYTKLSTGSYYVNVADCGVYMVALSAKRGNEPQPAAGKVEQLILTFPYSNDKRGTGL